jgi:hypothetical protein
VVVVDATGGAHPGVGSSCGTFPVTFVPGSVPRNRPCAANAGLDAARGDYLGFLDDDDAIAPEHIAGLVHALASSPRHRLAFSAARQRTPSGDVLHIGNARISQLVLLERCFFPIHVALFRRELVACCRFDETLDVCEDWDFWLQLAAHTRFLFHPQETAIYRADLGRSAAPPGAEPAHDAKEPYRARIRAKWADVRRRLIDELERDFERALALAQAGNASAAEALGRDVIERYPYHVGALNLCGTLCAQRGAFQAAARDFDAAVRAAPDDTASLFNLGQAVERLRGAAAARSLYVRVLELDPAHRHARARLARAIPNSISGQR